MRRSNRILIGGLTVIGLTLTACTTDAPTDDPEAEVQQDTGTEDDTGSDGADEQADAESAGDTEEGTEEGEFFVRADYERQLAQRDMEPEGDPETPWLQMIDVDEMVDTSEFAVDGPQDLCFSNASVANPWRVTGFITMEEQVKALQDEGVIGDFRVADAGDDDNKQISDIQSFISDGDCGAIIISPSTTATLTPAVEEACEGDAPVIVFDRGVNTDCAVTFIHPIGGYAYGAAGADFLVDNLEPGSSVLALRILPGVDVLEHRWGAANDIFANSELEVAGVEFTEGDAAQIKDIVTQYLQRGDVDGIWMDAGDGAVAAVEAFEDMGVDYPVFVGEDELGFMRKWDETGMTAIGNSYPTYQWRTPVLAAEKIWNGEEVPAEWILPQSPITEDELDEALEANSEMPDLHYAKFGGEDLPGFPEAWQDR
ncbi:MAG: substrate-binding domain-containing protein [Nesterenkonia sp.]